MTSSNQIKLESQIPPEPTNDSMNDFDLAEKALFSFSDITQMSNGPEQSISSESIDHHDVLNNIQSPFDTL